MLTIQTAFEDSLKNYVLRHVKNDLKGFNKKCREQIAQIQKVWGSCLACNPCLLCKHCNALISQ